MFCYSIFFWIYFSFIIRYFFCYMYLKSLRFQGIFIYSYSALTDGAAETGFFFAFCCYSKIRLFFYFRSYSFCLAYSYSFLRAYSSFLALSSFFFCIYLLLYSISFILRAISDSESFSRLLSSSVFAFQGCLATTGFFGLAAGLLTTFGFCFGSAVLGFLFSFVFGLLCQLLAWDLILDFILMIPPSFSLELSMNSDCASDRSQSFLNWKSLLATFSLMTSSMFYEAISDYTYGTSYILYYSSGCCDAISQFIYSFIYSSQGYSSYTAFCQKSWEYCGSCSSSESLASSSISAWVSLFIIINLYSTK